MSSKIGMISPNLRSLVLRSRTYIAKINVVSGVRPLSCNATKSNKFTYIKSYPELSKLIDEKIFKKEGTSKDDVVDVLSACKSLQYSTLDYDKFWSDPVNQKLKQKIEDILLHEKVEFDKDLLRRILLLKFPVITNVQILEMFYKRNPGEYIDKPIALIPFRHSLFNGDLKNALRITDLTTGHPNYIQHNAKKLRNGTIRLVGSAIGITAFSKFGVQNIIEMGYLSGGWKHLSSINAMLLTYILNSSFFLTIVTFGRQLVSSGGDYLTWQKGTFYTHWFKHADEMLFCSKIIEADIALSGGGLSGGEPSSELVHELCRADESATTQRSLQPGYTKDGEKIRLLDMKDNLEDLKMQAYWMSGGDGFEWVEPDQDPASLIWKQYMSQFDKQSLDQGSNGTLKWADELMEEK